MGLFDTISSYLTFSEPTYVEAEAAEPPKDDAEESSEDDVKEESAEGGKEGGKEEGAEEEEEEEEEPEDPKEKLEKGEFRIAVRYHREKGRKLI
jgi:hypothetical protein